MGVLRASVIISVSAVILDSGYTVAQDGTGQASAIGLIDGQPLGRSTLGREAAVGSFRVRHLRAPNGPADEREMTDWLAGMQCDSIRIAITGAARATQMRRFGISATPQEVKAAGDAYWRGHDPEADAKKQRDDAAALVTALTEVYEHGMDQQRAYEKYLAPRGYPVAAWQGNLNVGRTPEGRASMARLETLTADELVRGSVRLDTKRVERDHLDAAVDQNIASTDPTFRAYLDELRRGPSGGSPPSATAPAVPVEHRKYVMTKRAEWWQAREAEVKVVLYDPALAQQCGTGLSGPSPFAPPPAFGPARPGVGTPQPASAMPITLTPIGPAGQGQVPQR